MKSSNHQNTASRPNPDNLFSDLQYLGRDRAQRELAYDTEGRTDWAYYL